MADIVFHDRAAGSDSDRVTVDVLERLIRLSVRGSFVGVPQLAPPDAAVLLSLDGARQLALAILDAVYTTAVDCGPQPRVPDPHALAAAILDADAKREVLN